jgi:hypothetical protein
VASLASLQLRHMYGRNNKYQDVRRVGCEGGCPSTSVKIFRPSTTSCRPSSLLYPNSASAKMSIPNKHPAANFSRLSTSEETVYISPASLSEPFPAPSYNAGPVDMGPGGIEMRQTFVRQNTDPSFPGQGRQYTLALTEEYADNVNSFRDAILP